MLYNVDGFLYIERTLHSWNNLICPCYINHFLCCWIWFASILFRIFASIFIKDIGLWFSCFMFVWFLYQDNIGPHTVSWKLPLSSEPVRYVSDGLLRDHGQLFLELGVFRNGILWKRSQGKILVQGLYKLNKGSFQHWRGYGVSFLWLSGGSMKVGPWAMLKPSLSAWV